MNLIGKKFKVNSDGYVMLVDYMGSDSRIEDAARVSYGEGTRTVSKTRDLIRYLYRHRHTTPFEQCELVFKIRMEMDTNRQNIRHRMASVNEYSTRYSLAIDSCNTTSPDQWRLQSSNNKQGSIGFLIEWPDDPECLTEEAKLYAATSTPGQYLSRREKELHNFAKEVYEERIKLGIAREQARKDLPLSTYTEFYWKIDLHNLFHYLKLRCDSHAQLEIRNYANIIACITKELFPLAFEAWYDYSFCSSNFTRLDKELLKYIYDLYGAKNNLQDTILFLKNNLSTHDQNYINYLGMSKRELEEFWGKLEIPGLVDFDINKYQLYES